MDYKQRRLLECDAKISWYQYALSSLPRSAPTHASDVYRLATARLKRYTLSKKQDDLEQSILGFTEAILSLPLRLPSSNINQAFHCLTLATFLRAKGSKHPEDVRSSVIYLRYRRGLPHDVHNPISFPVTSYLVSALGFQAEFELGDVDQDIEEMADLCDELLDSDISTASLTRPIRTFAETIRARVIQTYGVPIPSEKVIGCLRRMIIRLPDLALVSIVLTKCLLRRFEITVSDDDYNEGMAILDKIIRFRGPGDTPRPYQAMALWTAVKFPLFRFETSGKPEHLEQAIYFNRTLLDRMSLEDPGRDEVIKQHSRLQEYRTDDSGVTSKWETFIPLSTPTPSAHSQAPAYPSEESTPSITNSSSSSPSRSPSLSPAEPLSPTWLIPPGADIDEKSDSPRHNVDYLNLVSRYCFYTGSGPDKMPEHSDLILRSYSPSSIEESLSTSHSPPLGGSPHRSSSSFATPRAYGRVPATALDDEVQCSGSATPTGPPMRRLPSTPPTPVLF